MISVTNIIHAQLLTTAFSVAGELPWAPPVLQNNAIIVILVIVFAVIDLLACHPKGMMIRQLSWLRNTHNARTFEASTTVYPWLKPALLLQIAIFSGLSLFCILDDDPAQHLFHPGVETWLRLGAYMGLPALIFLIQIGCYNWFCYLFRSKFQQIIMNRTYTASLILLSPFSTLVFIGALTGTFNEQTILILLAGLFILSQILFIFNGIRIFSSDFIRFLVIIVYLCTLEIAPLWVFWTKITT